MLTTSLQTSKKSLSTGSFEFNPFKYGINNAALITVFTDLFNNFSFNRGSSKWFFDFSNHRRNGKSLLTYGYESNRLNDWLLKWRMNMGRTISISLNAKRGLTALITPQFNNRNYQLTVYTLEPAFVYNKMTKFGVTASYKRFPTTNPFHSFILYSALPKIVSSPFCNEMVESKIFNLRKVAFR